MATVNNPTFSTSVTTPSVTSASSLSINSTSANLTLQTTTSGNVVVNGAGTFDVQDATTFAGTLTANGVATFNTDVDYAFAGTENISVTSDLAGTVNVFNLVATPSGTAGTTRGIFIQQADSANTNGLDNAIVIDNADTNLALGSALSVTSAAGGVTVAVDLSDADIVTAIDIGANLLTASGDSINDFTGSGLQVTSNALNIQLTSSGTTGSTSSNSGLEVSASGLTLLKGCVDNEILKYTDAGGWACATDGTGAGVTLQGAYDSGSAGDQVIALDSTQDSIIIRNPASAGSDSAYVLTLDQLSTGATGGLSIQSAGTGNLLLVTDTTATARDVLTIADGGATTFRNQTDSASGFVIQKANGNAQLTVDTTEGNVIIGLNDDNNAKLFVSSTDHTIFKGNALGTDDLANNELLWLQKSGADVVKITNTGKTTFSNTVNSTTAFQIQNTAGASLFSTDTTEGGKIVLLGNTSSGGDLSSWTATSSLYSSTSRTESGTAVANGYIYVVGGADSGGTPVNTVYYAKINSNGTLGTFATSSSTLPSAREGVAVVSANGYLYALGGAATGGEVSQTSVYYAKINTDGSIGSWQTNTNSLTVALQDHGAFVANGYVYVVGGVDASSTTQDEVYYAKLNPDGTTGPWTTNSTVLTQARNDFGLVVIGGNVYVIGGEDTGGAATNTVYYAALNINGSIGSWTSDADTITAREDLKAVALNGKIYAFGGINGTAQDDVYYTTVASGGGVGAWSTDDDLLPANRQDFMATSSNGYIYLLGGTDGTTPSANVYYASGARVQVGGALDLVGLSNGDLSNPDSLGDGGLGGQLTAGNTKVVGTLEVQGQSSFAQNVAVNGDLSIGGSVNKIHSLGNITPGSQAVSTSTSLVTTTVDTVATASGTQTGMAIGTDGLAVISYKDTTSNYLKVLKCGNESCSSGNTSSNVDTSSNVGSDSSLAIGTDGYPVISYRDVTAGSLKVVKCGNPACTSGNIITTVYDTTNSVGLYSSIAIGTDGIPVISHLDTDANDLYVTKCGNTSCTSGNTNTLVESTNSVGHYSAIAIGTDGYPVISHFNDTSDDLVVTKCSNAACTTDTTTALDTANQVGQYTSIAIATDGYPIISYYDLAAGNLNLKVAKCITTDCATGASFYTVDSTNTVGQETSIAIGTDGLPIIAYWDATNQDLRVTKCSTFDCSAGYTSTSVDTTNNAGHDSSIAILPSGLPIISGVQQSTLRVNRCGNTSCSGSGTVYSGGLELGSTNTSFQNGYINNIKAGNGRSLSLSTNGIDRLTIGTDGSTVLKANSSTILQVQNAAGASIMDVKQLNTNFGGYAESGAFIDRNSYFNDEFNIVRTNPSVDTAGSAENTFGDSGGWGTYEQAAGECEFTNPADTINGTAQLTANAAANECLIMVDDAINNARLMLDADFLPVMLFKVKPSQADATSGLYVGMSDSTDALASTAPNSFIGFTNDNAGTLGSVWKGVTRNGGTSTTVDCVDSVSTTQFALLKVEVVSITDVRFYVDADVSNGVSWRYCGSSASNVPTASLAPQIHWQERTGGATSNLQVDFYRVWQDDNQPNPDAGQEPEQNAVQSPSVNPQQQIGIIDFNEATSADIVYDNNVYIKGKLFVNEIVANKITGLEVVTDQITSLQTQIQNLLSAQQQSLYLTNSQTSSQQPSGSGNNLQGNMFVSGNLAIAGTVSANQLAVNGLAVFNGDVTINGNTSTQNIIVNGHLVTSGTSPNVQVLAESNIQNNILAPVVTVEGNDISGTITINTVGEQIITPGELAKIEFSKAYSNKPKIFIDASNLEATQIKIFKQASITHFVLSNIDELQPGKIYVFEYFVVE